MSSGLDGLTRSHLRKALSQFNGVIFTRDDARRFLMKVDHTKDDRLRLPCWLVGFNLILADSDQWADGMWLLYERYFDIISRFSDMDDPGADVTAVERDMIYGDVRRYVKAFEVMACDVGLRESDVTGSAVAACRILCALELSENGFVYYQGYDRYTFVSYLLSLHFCTELGLSRMFAEACAFALSLSFIRMVLIGKYLANPVETTLRYEIMDRELELVDRSKMQILRDVQQSAIYFALRWEIVLFADEHDIRQVLLIWDAAICMNGNYREFVFGLCIAHFAQVPIAGHDEIMVEKIQQFRGWDMDKMMKDTVKYMEKDWYVPWYKNTRNVIIVLLVLLGFVACLKSII